MDNKAQLPEGPFGTFAADFPSDQPMLATVWAARSLADTLISLETAARPPLKLRPPKPGNKKKHAAAQQRLDESDRKIMRSLTMGFNRDMRELTQRLHQGYDQFASKFYPATGVVIEDHVGTCYAEIALTVGRSFYFAIAYHINPQALAPTASQAEYMPISPEGVVLSRDKFVESFGVMSKLGLNQLAVALLNEHREVHEKLFPASTNGRTPPAKPYELNPSEWIGWTQTKVAKKWFQDKVSTPQGWTDFANKMRDEGMMFNHPVSGPREVMINRSVFPRYDAPIPC